MPIHIHIEANHATDIISELQVLTKALTESRAMPPMVQNVAKETKVTVVEKPEIKEEPVVETKTEEKPVPAFLKKEVEAAKPSPAKLKGKQHVAEANKMIEAGKKDEKIYPLLSDAQKERVDKELGNIPAETSDEPEAGLFDDDEQEAPKDITIDSVKELIQVKGRDAQGNDDPEKYAQIRGIMRDAIPADLDVKISNVPADKVAQIYAEINKL